VDQGIARIDPQNPLALGDGLVEPGVDERDTSKKITNAKFTVTATDSAGNSTKTTITYSVK